MASLSGKAAEVKYSTDSKLVGFNSWSIDADANMLDVTTYTTGTLQWRSFIAGLSGFTGTISGFFDAASTGQTILRTNMLTPTTALFVGYFDKVGGENLRGSVLISTMSHSVDIDGTADVTFSMQGTGSLTYSTAT